MEGATYFLVLDCLVMSGVLCFLEPIFDPLRRTVDLGRLLFKDPLKLRVHGYVQREKLRGLLASSPNLNWAVDRVMFQPGRLPYRFGTYRNMFKWKPLSENSRDFYYRSADRGLYYKAKAPGYQSRTSSGAVDLRETPRTTVHGAPSSASASSPHRHLPWVTIGMLTGYMSAEMDTLTWKQV
jgi:hypothetical protein